MRETATGRITGGVFGLADMIAASSTFRAWTGAADAAEAMTHVYRWQFRASPAALQAARPCAVVWQANRMELAQYGGGSFNLLGGSGGVLLVLTDADASVFAERQTSGDTFAGQVDGVVNDVVALAGVDDHLDLTGLDLLRPLSHSRDWDDPADGGYWEAMFLARWGRN